MAWNERTGLDLLQQRARSEAELACYSRNQSRAVRVMPSGVAHEYEITTISRPSLTLRNRPTDNPTKIYHRDLRVGRGQCVTQLCRCPAS